MELIIDSAPFALGFATLLFLLLFLIRKCLMKKPFPFFLSVIGCVYLGFLLSGTLRPSHVEELFAWRQPMHMDVGFQLSVGQGTSSLHALFNVALFIPWGFLGMTASKKLRSALSCLFSSVLMTFFIETYQLYHMRSFDFGDIVTNILGCAIGILLALPLVLHGRTRHG